MRARDSQRQKVYDAELLVDKGIIFTSLDDVQGYIDKLIASVYLRKRYGRWGPAVRIEETELTRTDRFDKIIEAIVVSTGSGNRRRGMAYSFTRRIHLPKNCWYEQYILHELAHILAPSAALHNWEYVEVLVDLTRHARGKGVERELKAALRKHRARFTAPRTGRKLSPEQREAAVARLAKAREAKAEKVAAGRDPDDGPESLKRLLRF